MNTMCHIQTIPGQVDGAEIDVEQSLFFSQHPVIKYYDDKPPFYAKLYIIFPEMHACV